MNFDKSKWPRVRFGDVVRQIKDVVNPSNSGLERYIAGEHMDSDELRIRRWGTINSDYLGPAFHMRFKPGQVLYGSRRTYLRKVAVPDFEGICANTTFVLEPKDTTLLVPEFLPLIMQATTFHDHSMKQSKGSVNPYINFSDLAWYEFALPTVEEQQEFVRILNSATAVAERHKELSLSANALWQVTAESHFREEFLELQTYPMVELGEVTRRISDGPFGSKLKTSHYSDQGARVIRLQNIGDRIFDNTDKAFIASSYYENELRAYAVEPGDIIMAGLGDERIPPGRACIVPSSLGNAINKADCYCIRPVVELLAADYLVAFLNSRSGLRQSAAYKQGTTRYRLNVSNIKRMRVPLPPLQIQAALADLLSAIFSVENTALIRGRHTRRLVSHILDSFECC
jgi:type I restriction enzyme S subunit